MSTIEDSDIVVPHTFNQTAKDKINPLQNNIDDIELLNNYEINFDYYPIPALVKHYEDNGFIYEDIRNKYPQIFPYDNSWNEWNRDVRQIAVSRKLKTEPIKRYVNVIWRYKFGAKEKIVYSERFVGLNVGSGEMPEFKHINGMYQRHNIRPIYNKDKNIMENKLRGIEKVYTIDYDKKLLEELFLFSPPNKQQKFYAVIMNVPYGSTGLFKQDEFKNLKVEDLVQIAMNAKGHVRQNTTVIEQRDVIKQQELNQQLPEGDIQKMVLNMLSDPEFKRKYDEMLQQNTNKSNNDKTTSKK